MIKAIIFDMDGVIVDSEPLWKEAVEVQLKRRGVKIVHTETYKKFVDNHLRGRNQKHGIAMIKKWFGLKGSYQEILAERLSILFNIFNQKLKKIPGSIPFIKKLHQRGYPLLLASSSPQRVINYILKRYRLWAYFKKSISGDNFKKGKPNPEIFLKAAKILKEKPSNILVIEDSISGVQAAYRAKMKCIAIKQPYTSFKYLKTADKIVNNLSEITLKQIKNL